MTRAQIGIAMWMGWVGVSEVSVGGEPIRAHDPCVIRADGWYYLYATGRGVSVHRSRDLRRWERVGQVFDPAPAWAFEAIPGFRGHLWAPDIVRVGDAYHLTYSVSRFGRNRSCIGLAVNRTLDPADPGYRWEDRGIVIRSEPGRDDWNAIDSNLVCDRKGGWWMAYGSFWGGIQLVRLHPDTGRAVGDPPTPICIARRPESDAIEAPFIVFRDPFYYLFVSYDFCCRGVDSSYRIVVGRARDVVGPYHDRVGRPLTEGGGTQILASHGDCRGPGHNAVLMESDRSWLIHHMYDAAREGRVTLQVRPLRWAEDGWPSAGEPLEIGLGKGSADQDSTRE